MLYECHITVHVDHAEKAETIAKQLKWKTSQILRDPVLGDKPFFYLTTHSDNASAIFARMNLAKNNLLLADIPILREKVEAIIHDSKEIKG